MQKDMDLEIFNIFLYFKHICIYVTIACFFFHVFLFSESFATQWLRMRTVLYIPVTYSDGWRKGHQVFPHSSKSQCFSLKYVYNLLIFVFP